jgi:streptogramin lyase
VLIEYAFPVPHDLPHDLALGLTGQVIVTGMLSNRMYLLDPATGAFSSEEIPVPAANPRAVEVDGTGAWWVLLGGPKRVARFADGEWSDWPVGVYGHSIGLAPDGLIWTNGHFTQRPERVAVLDPRSGEVRSIEVPTPPAGDGGRNIQYELRIGPEGVVWTSQLVGNRVMRYDPTSDRFDRWDLPTPHSGPRRFDVDAAGILWIPEYANNRLARFDPSTGTFREWELPLRDALPYVVRVDSRRQDIWIGTGGADALLQFDISAGSFRVYPTPSRGALIRHLAIDETTGTVWAAYGASPAREPVRILRLDPR